jgi:hypothetical protein
MCGVRARGFRHSLERTAVVRRAGFRKSIFRGDIAFTQTKHLDRWGQDSTRLPELKSRELERPARYTIQTDPARPESGTRTGLTS